MSNRAASKRDSSVLLGAALDMIVGVVLIVAVTMLYVVVWFN